jgi:hypothetical protein
MSLNLLSTELDTRVFGYLNRLDRSRLMRVSKTYYLTGRPLLYTNIRLRNDQDDQIKLLLTTFLERKELTDYVQSFELEGPSTDPVPGPMTHSDESRKILALYDRVVPYVPLAEHRIEYLECGGLTPQYRGNWTFQVFQDDKRYDGALALLLCLATQMRKLSITVPATGLSLTLDIMQRSRNPTATGSVSPLFANLEKLRIISTWASGRINDISVTTGLQELILKNDRVVDYLYAPHISIPIKTPLRKLVLHNVKRSTTVVENMLGNPWFESLEVLKVQNPTMPQSATVHMIPYDYSLLKETVLTSLPALKEFTWTGTQAFDSRITFTPFGSFKDFNDLEVLRIDYKLFSEPLDLAEVGSSRQQIMSGLGKFVNFLPPNLQVLAIYGLEYSVLRDLFSDWDVKAWRPMNGHDTMRSFRQSLPKLKKITVIINMARSGLHTPAVNLETIGLVLNRLPLLGDVMMSSGVQFELWYWTKRDNTSKYFHATSDEMVEILNNELKKNQ